MRKITIIYKKQKSKKRNKIKKVKQKRTYTYMHKYIDSRYMFTYAFVCVYILYTILIYIAYFSVLFDTNRKAKEKRKKTQ